MPNLVKNLKASCKEAFKDKIIVVFLAIILVVAINHVVFSYLARDTVKAITAYAASTLYTPFKSRSIAAGSNSVVLGELLAPDPMYQENLKCGWFLDDPGSGIVNECSNLLDADGYGSVNAGTDDDDAKTLLGLDYIGDAFSRSSIIFNSFDSVCADDLDNPTEVYVDGSDIADNLARDGSANDCIPGNGGVDKIILDTRLTAGVLDSATFYDVSGGGNNMTWVHSEKVKKNQAIANYPTNPQVAGYDFDMGVSNNLYITDSTGGPCDGSNPGQFEPTIESAWQDARDDGVFDPIEDNILWDYSNCLATGPCANGGCLGINFPVSGVPYFAFNFVDDGSCGGTANGKWDVGEPIWGELTYVGTPNVYEGGELPVYDPSSCLVAGVSSGRSIVTPEKFTESIWLVDMVHFQGDKPLAQGNNWASLSVANPNSYQGDAAGVWGHPCGAGNLNGECFLDNDSSGTFNGGGAEGVIIDVDGSGTYTAGDTDVYHIAGAPGGQTLTDLASAYGQTPKYDPADCDGDASSYMGGCIPVSPGTPLTSFVPGFPICTNNLINPTLIYIDGSGDCNPATPGADVIIRDDYGNAALDTAVYNASATWRYFDNVAPFGTYDYLFPANGDQLYYSPAGIPVGPIMLNYGLIYVDINNDGILAANGDDTILDDIGTIQNGLAADNQVVDNNFLNFDSVPDFFSSLTLINKGTAVADQDYTNLRIYIDLWPLNGGPTDAKCDGSSNSMFDDFYGGNLTYNNGMWDLSNVTLPLNPMPIVPVKFCVLADIPSTAKNGRTIQLGIPKLVDNGPTPGLYDPGEAGFFVASSNDGPVNADAIVNYVYTIFGGTSTGHTKIEPIIPPPGQPLPTPQVTLPTGVEVGDLVKSANLSSVYLITSDGKRAVFPHEKVYFSYYADFSRVKVISDLTLSQIALGKNMTLRAGTNLMKMESNPNVYAIEPGGVRRLVPSQDVAVALYGRNWAQKVIDMSDAFWGDYTDGPALTNSYPAGTLLQYAGASEIYYLDNGQKRLVTATVFENNSFQDKFVIKNVSSVDYSYPAGTNLLAFGDFSIALEKNPLFKGALIPGLLKK
jgi:hypothetical protein